ncbi:hypothetical protein G5I_05793 [Acromyrmex echinatior]|uniref:Uncharacterized protein n=1 Tax=Acromyrmex echinatior TaxID=103372 RepID=F4WJB5_ACREC|nr:hypothetical protein G5I_05793 [Acromyrmex echinatior]
MHSAKSAKEHHPEPRLARYHSERKRRKLLKRSTSPSPFCSLTRSASPSPAKPPPPTTYRITAAPTASGIVPTTTTAATTTTTTIQLGSSLDRPRVAPTLFSHSTPLSPPPPPPSPPPSTPPALAGDGSR